MILIGLAGQARAGKDTIADYLCRRYGFVKFAFSNALYYEVSQAFGVAIEFLKGESKEEPSILLSLKNCMDPEFVKVALPLVEARYPGTFSPLDEFPLSPRWILQWWGTDYRRAQDPQYWIKKAAEFLDAVIAMPAYPEQQQQYFVETGTRFENEREFIHTVSGGNVWHVYRGDAAEAPGQGHVSANPLPVLEGEREIYNNDTVERLFAGVDLLLTTSAKFVRVEPMVDFVPASDELIAAYDRPLSAPSLMAQHTDHAIEDTDIGCPACQQEIANDDRAPNTSWKDQLIVAEKASIIDPERGAETQIAQTIDGLTAER